ncbi:zinc finger protein 416-like [Dugong dugon]
MAAASPRDLAEGCVNFEDVAIDFSQEEWGLLDETQKLFYCDVMLENFAVISSLACWHGVEEEKASSEQSVSLEGVS